MSDETAGAAAPDNYAIGISFGNSYSSIAHISREGKVEVIANEEGDRQIPSILSYVEGEEYHGQQAKAQLVRNAKNSVAFFRDYVGKSYSAIDPTPCQSSAHPSESDGQVIFTVRDSENETPNKLSVSEVTSRHLRRLKNSAADYTGKTITSAVMSIPTDTTEDQKVALTKAAKDTGVDILQFMPEPIAAVVAYDSRTEEALTDKLVAVADLGGNRSDAAVIASRGGLYSLLATTHDYELGGVQLDHVLIDYFAKEFEKKHKTDPRKNDRSLAKMKLEAEAVKKSLSQSASATFSVESLADGVDFRSTINRTRFQLLGVKVFQRFTRLVEEVIKKAGLDVLDIDEVILSGGTSHVPKIAENIQALFPETTQVLAPATATTALNPSELAARGAAVQASMIQDFDKEDIEQSTHEMVTVTPHTRDTIGVQVTGNSAETFTVIVPATTAVPARKSAIVDAPGGDVLLRICEGERDIKITKAEPKAKTNGEKAEDDEDEDEDSEEEEEEDNREKIWKITKPLAELSLKGVKKGAKLEVNVNIDSNLGLSVAARELKGKGGVRGNLEAPQATENGAA